MSKRSSRETTAIFVGAAATLVPAMVMAGFMPEWDVLPATSWVAIATIGSAVAGVIWTPRRWLRASIAGATTGCGALMGLMMYTYLRYLVLDIDTFLNIELALGAGIGSIPGVLLFHKWVYSTAHRQ